jgi:large subunit ribosomal protein L1
MKLIRLHHKKTMKQGKRIKAAQKLYDKNKTYSIDKALEILEKLPKPKFDESVEVHVRLGINAKKTDQQLRGTVTLPHGTGKMLKVAAFTSVGKKEAKDAGADVIGEQDLIEKISSNGSIDFDVAVATPEMMPKLAKIAKILGPKGLMPNPKTETVGPNIGEMIKGLKKGKASFKSDSDGNIHQIVGKRSFDQKKLKENISKFLEKVEKSKPAAVKGKLIKAVNLSASMSPSIRVK